MDLPLGAVLGTKGVERHAITFHGQEAHSGSTPMNARRDALAAAAKLSLEIRPIAMKHPDAVCTIGSIKTFPGIVTAVVGRCEATLDQRDLNADVLAAMYREAQDKSQQFAQKKKAAPWSGRASGTLRRSRFIPFSSVSVKMRFAKLPATRIVCPPARCTMPRRCRVPAFQRP